MIFYTRFDYHQINMTGEKSSGTSSQKVNLNPEIGKSLTLIHTSLLRLGGFGNRMKFYDNIRK